MMCCSVEMVFLHEVPRLSRMVVFCITFIAYLQPQSRLVTSMSTVCSSTCCCVVSRMMVCCCCARAMPEAASATALASFTCLA